MNLAFVSVSDALGGSETALLALVRGLRRRQPDWALHLILPGTGPLAARAEAEGVSVSVVPMPESMARLGESGSSGRAAFALKVLRAAVRVPGYESRLRRALARIDPDVVHSNGLKAHVTTARIAPARSAVVWHLHEYIGPRQLTRQLLRRYASRCAAGVANSRSVASDARRALEAAAPISVVHNAVDVEHFAPAGPVADLDALTGTDRPAPGTVRIGLVATFARWKGHETFIRAIAALPRDASIRAYIVGGGVYDTEASQFTIEELKRLAGVHGVADRILFTGFIDDPAPVYRALDVVVHASSQPEPFGLVIAEAMACGRAVIMSNAGGASELVSPGADAVAHDAGDAGDLADAMQRLIVDAPLRARLGRAARASAVSRFDLDRFAREFEEVYRSAIDRERRRAG
jgi:glycosyltransferase involved in cell wall biosynthesis